MKLVIPLSPASEKTIAVALATLPLLIFLGFVVSDALDRTRHHARLALLKREHLVYSQLVDGAPAAQTQLASLESSANALYPTLDPSAAASRVETEIGLAIKSACGTAGQGESEIRSNPDYPVTLVETRERFACDIGGLVRLLHTLDEARPVLLVERLAIDASTPPRGGPRALAIDLAVDAYVRGSRR